jgi:hypothetical protein
VCGGVGDGGDEWSGAALLEGVRVGPDLVGGVGGLVVVVAIGVVDVKGASGIDKAGGIIVRVVAVVGGSIGIEGVGDADDAGVIVETAVAVAGGAVGVAVAAPAAAGGVVEGVGAFAGEGVSAEVGISSGAEGSDDDKDMMTSKSKTHCARG